jgi:ABC-type dipeptide/oligopeptide/nickel transport system permease component
VNTLVLKRIAFVVPQLVLITAVVFVLLRLLPADPVDRIAGQFATPEIRAQVEQDLGLDESLGAQLGSYLAGAFQGDFGTSWSTSDPVTEEMVERFPLTLQLIILAFFVALAIAIPLGRASAAREGSRTDKAAQGYSLFAGAQPDFWWGLMFLFVFFFKAGVLPAPLGILTPGEQAPDEVTHFILIDALIAGEFGTFVDALRHFALPVITLAFVLTGPFTKMTRQSVLSVSKSEYMLYAEASGLSDRSIKRSLLRNGLAPVLTLAAIFFGFLLGGAALIETVFTLNGLGLYAVQRMLILDFPAVQGVVVWMTAFALLMYLIMDILYAALDPRVRYSE